MKRIIILYFSLLIAIIVQAREPYGDYIVRYIVTDATTYHPIYNPLKITHTGIRVENTNAGVKVWEATYQGPIRLTNKGGSERFHNFYLTNQHVEFNISDRRFWPYKGKLYYMIIFDGQVQLAEPRESYGNSSSDADANKDYDLFMNMMRNPDLLLDDLIFAGLNIGNTKLLSKYRYENSPKVRPVFSNSNGSFDKERFDAFYNKACAWYEKLKYADTDKIIKQHMKYHRDNIFTPR